MNNIKHYNFFNIKLDKYQTKAVIENNRSYLVIAGAGSGKTLTIVGKINYLIKEKKIDPRKILCISFTNETVNSLVEKLDNFSIKVDVKTFHKLSLDIIGKSQIASSNLLDYIIDEFFNCIIYWDHLGDILDEYIERNNLLKSNFLCNFKKTILSFIHTFKSSNYKISKFYDILKSCNSEEKLLVLIIFKIYLIYEEELLSTKMIDFDDMINLAIEKVNNLTYFKYKYLIIDEYQDTSFSKYQLLKKLYDRFNLNLIAVGDDYQSIYSFSGCNLEYFLNFKEYFPYSKIIKLRNTYRNPKDIVDISKRFIRKNKKQINKKLIANNYIKNPLTIVYSNNVSTDIERIIEPLDDIFLLGRNNKDLFTVLENKSFSSNENLIVYNKYPNKKITFLTVHASKGLEAKNIIVLNNVDDTLGFPNKIKENNLLLYLKNNNEKLYEEERRLFYVALTRAKEKVYLFTNKEHPSIFIKELLKDYKWKIKILDFE